MTWLRSDHVYGSMDANAAGSTNQIELTGAMARNLPFPLPPIAEQERIVAKVDELMALCDELEAAQTEREARRARLVTATLHRLSNGTSKDEGATEDGAGFKETARFYINHLPEMTTRRSHSRELRSTIRSLAIRGRLVAQNSNDEPASCLLDRIREMRIATKPRKAVMSAASTKEPMSLPASWEWSSFGSITTSRDGERVPVSKEERSRRGKVYDYYGASGVIDKIDDFLFDKPLLLIGEDGANLVNRSSPIAFIARGQYWVNNHAHVVDAFSEQFLQYLELYINAIDLKPYVTGTAQPKMNQAKMNSIPVAIPPEAEQVRITSKVRELLEACDDLESRLESNQTTRARLLNAVIREVLEGVG